MNAILKAVCASLALLAAAPAAQAQDWPNRKPVQFIVGFGPGASTDILSRLIALKLTESIGQAVVVENRPGAGEHRGARGEGDGVRRLRAARDHMERLKLAYKVDITHVPYQPAQAVGAAVAGHTQISSTSVPPAIPHVKSGKVRPIAVTSAQRSAALPEVPTVAELGHPGFDDLTWFAFFAPAGTPAAVVARLNAEVNRILELPDVKERLAQLGFDFRRNSPEEFAAYLRDEIPKWAKAVKDSGAKAD